MRPYNTRHKTLSLHSLGIHVPGSNAARARASSNSASPISMASSASPSKDYRPPTKRLKRAFSESSDDALPLERLSKKRDDAAKFENTPPPSPPAERRPSIEMSEDEEMVSKTIDMEGINDEIVEAVIVLLQNTGNRPHLVKELAAVLMLQLKIVQQSANPSAIISSRLATYLKRSGWSALAPCPLAKELESVHPRRTYFYLTTCPHLPLPDPAQTSALSHLAQSRAIISPSPSSAPSTSADDESDLERRRELSPSPEVDLSSPEFDDMDDDFAMPSTPIGSFSMRGFYMPPRPVQSASTRHGRAGSPPLEKDEKEFTQTADGLQKRKLNGDLSPSSSSSSSSGNAPLADQNATSMDLERDESSLFGPMSGLSGLSGGIPAFVSSPAIRPSTMMSLSFGRKDGEMDSCWAKFEGMLEWDRSPENIELEELDGLLDDY
ncbi:hypothetical protein C8A00DRAFT_28658 [Chaetomidium leptoderma]|uniref:GDS1 winged helix domain-containing protein n=1 Tax=Chaetomidium leptoderma TaxID=669021 RepID=A0AAN7A1X7_9PEZI|nr:hypothetical protein C8A00DRAFT_28658 [Chaetomidium leptoderma]